jgi:hypothetical protein
VTWPALVLAGAGVVIWLVAGASSDRVRRLRHDEHRRKAALLRILQAELPAGALQPQQARSPAGRVDDSGWRCVGDGIELCIRPSTASRVQPSPPATSAVPVVAGAARPRRTGPLAPVGAHPFRPPV